MRRILLAVLASGVLLAAAIGLPFALVVFAGNPWPGRAALELGDVDRLTVATLAVVTWIVWARFVIAILVEATEQRRAVRRTASTEAIAAFGCDPPRPASRSFAGLLAHRLITAILVLLPPARALPAVASPLGELVAPAPLTVDIGPIDQTLEAHVVRQHTRRSAEDCADVVIGRGDSLVGLAERHLGDGERWKEIFDLNRDVAQKDGMRLVSPSALRAGWTLTVPMAEHARPGASTRGEVIPASGERRTRRYVVRRGDGPWAVAEALVGDGARFPEVLAANIGLEVAPGFIWSGEQQVIHPGWIFRWPEAGGDAVVIADGDTLESVIGGVIEGRVTPPMIEAVAARNDGATTPDGAHVFDARNPDLIHPGQRFVITADRRRADRPDETERPRSDGGHRRPPPSPPNDGRPPRPDRPVADEPIPSPPDVPDDRSVRTTTPRRAPIPSAPTTVAASASTGPSSADTTLPAIAARPDAARRADESQPSMLPIGIGAAALSSGLLAMVEMSRRRRLRATRMRERLVEPSPRSVDVERELRSMSAPERLVRVDIAVRAATAPMLSTPHRIAAMLADPSGAITVATTGAVDLPAPWQREESTGTRWRVPGTVDVVDLAEAARGISAPCVALAPIGVTPSGSDVFVDLEAAGVLHVDADPVAATAVITGLATALASSMFAESVHLVGVGVTTEAFLEHPNKHLVGTLDEAVRLCDELVVAPPQVTTQSTFALRARHTSGEDWEAAVVFAVGGEARLAPWWRPRPGVALVTTGEQTPGSWALRPSGECWVLEPPAIELTPVGITADELLVVTELVGAPRTSARRNGAERRAVDTRWPRDFLRPDSAADDEPDWDFMIRLFGLVDVVDRELRAATFRKSKSLELLAWLGVHRAQATRLGARSALWEIDVRDATFANVVSEARRALGSRVAPPAGEDWIGRSSSPSLPLHDRIVTDADLVQLRLERASRQTDREAVSTLRAAVALVRSAPFLEADYLWPDAEGTTSRLVVLATSCTTELAERELAGGNLDGVFEATGAGLRVLPGHEESIGLRMRAHAARGDRAGIRHEWASYERVVVADPWTDGEPSAALVRLRQDLLGRGAQ